MKQRLAILGSTGSIGTQTLDIVARYADMFEVRTLVAGTQWELLARQAIEFDADTVVIADESKYELLSETLRDYPIKVFTGAEAINQVVGSSEIDVVVNALVGYAGLHPTIAAIRAGKKLALANKESLVVAGELVMRLSQEHNVPIVPIDSEHSAIFQCLVGEQSPLSRLILTCSGGALRDLPREALAEVTPEQALCHPQWSMGRKITIDSATLVNKGFEVIEAHWLFGVEAERISVVIHPQSIIHSMVEFEDGAVKAQLGSADMRIPISYALLFPHRAAIKSEPFDFVKHSPLTFSEVDNAKYPALGIAFECLRRGGNASCVMNGANEVAVATFLAGECRLTDIPLAIEYALQRARYVEHSTLEQYDATDAEARALAKEYLAGVKR